MGKFAVLVSFLVCLVTGPLQAQEAPRFLIGFAQDDMNNDWRAAQVRDVARALEAHPHIDFIFTDAQGSAARNILDIEDLADRGIDLLMVSPRYPEAMAPAIAAVYASGIPVVILTRELHGESFTTFVGPDDVTIAAEAAHTLADHLGGHGRVLVLAGVPTAPTALRRSLGFAEALTAYPELEIVAEKVANYLRQDAIEAVEQVLRDGPAFDALFAQSDSMAEGARLALEAHGIDPRTIPSVGIDYISAARDAIRDGRQIASFTYPTSGTEAAALAVRILAGEEVPRRVVVPSTRVTRDTVETIDPIF